MAEQTSQPMAPEDYPRQYRHLRVTAPSDWVRRFAPLVRVGGPVLDIAAGNGRHSRLFLERGHPVVSLDRNVEPLERLHRYPKSTVREVDLEDGGPWPLADAKFAGIVVTNYLHRPLFEPILASLEPGGVLIYETFAMGNERMRRPHNPDHLLQPDELLRLVDVAHLQVVAFEQGLKEIEPLPGVIQRICAVADSDPTATPRPLHPEGGPPEDA